jgi:hypothetical protein
VVPSDAVAFEHVSTVVFARGRRVAAAMILGSVLLAAGPASAQVSDEEKAAARALATQGADAIKGGRFAEGLDFVQRAESIMHAPTHLLLIARAQVGSGKLVAASETYLKLSREELAPNAPNAFKNAQAAARTELAALEPRIASLRISVDLGQKKATVKLDDVAVAPALLGVYRPIDPGTHNVAIFVTGGTPVKTTVELKEGEKKDVQLAVPDAPGGPVGAADNPDSGKADAAPRDHGPGFFTPLRGAGVGLLVVGVAGVAAGAAMAAKGFSTQSTANANAIADGCTSNGSVCTGAAGVKATTNVTPLDETAAKDKTIGAVLLPIGIAALGGGVALLIIGKPKPAAQGSMVPFFTGTGGGVRGAF